MFSINLSKERMTSVLVAFLITIIPVSTSAEPIMDLGEVSVPQQNAGTSASSDSPGGQVGESGASTINHAYDDKKETLGTKITKNNLTWIIGVPAVFALAATLAYCFWQRRADNNSIDQL